MSWFLRRSDISPHVLPPQPTRKTLEEASLDEYATLMRRLGRMEADVERLELSWTNHKDQFNRLVNRLEKRDERAEKREREPSDQVDTPEVSDLRARVLGRRR